MKRSLSVILAALAMAFTSPLVARATDLTPLLVPTNLHVIGDDGAWRAQNDFYLAWGRPPSAQVGFNARAAHYRVRDWLGREVIPEALIGWNDSWVAHLRVPGPGTYVADVWLEGPAGELGPPASTALRFDDTRPAPATPTAPASWVAGNEAVVVRIEHPSGPQPISGIRGYAVSVGPATNPGPCAAVEWCATAETDLQGGIAADTVSLGVLPEGVHLVRAVAVSGSGMTSAEARTTVVRVDATLPSLTLEGAPAGWAKGPVRITARARDAISGMATSGPTGPLVSIAVDGGVPKQEAGDSTSAVVGGEGVHRVAFYARDAAGNSGERSPQLAAVRIDETPPTAAFGASQDPADPERIEALIADALSGPDPARGSIAVRPVGSRQGFVPVPTSVANHRLVGRWDSDAFPAGSYEFVATAFDAAGNSVSSGRRQGGGRMILRNPVKTPTSLVAGFGGRRLIWQRCSRQRGERHCRNVATRSFEKRPAIRTVPFGRGVYFGGRLLTASGSPLAGQAVEIVETFAAGTSLPRRTTVVKTAADGVFVSRLAPGPSRGVEARFAGSPTLSRGESGGVWLNVLAGVRMHASSGSARVGGAAVVFSGRIEDLDASIPHLGRPIELQFRVPGSDWSEFRTVQTDARGRFRYAYAFSDDDSRGVRFQFRAFAPAQAGWPYEPASSRPVFVTGR